MRLSVLACASALTLACGPEAVRIVNDGTIGPLPSTVAWLPDGSGLVVDDAWLVDPDSGAVVADVRGDGVLSPDASRRLVLDTDSERGDELEIEDLLRHRVTRYAVEQPADAPRPDDDALPYLDDVSWLDASRVLVTFSSPDLGTSYRELDLRTGTWRDSTVDSEFDRATAEPLAAGNHALFSSAEGCAAIDVVDASDQHRATIDLGCVRDAEVTVSSDGQTIWLTSDADLTATDPFEGVAGSDDAPNALTLYEWTDPLSGMRPVRARLPSNARIDPAGRGFAWRTEDGFCIGDPDAAFRCYDDPVPAR